MENEIISYLEMCQREGASLQQGMNYRLGPGHSVLLMSTRPRAPYRDLVTDDGATLIYEGHDAPRVGRAIDPKALDQPEFTAGGQPTQNGKFHQAAQDYRKGLRAPEPVRVYEKIRQGIWSYNGLFHLVDSWKEGDGRRLVFKFKLIVVEDPDEDIRPAVDPREPTRLIPTSVKLEVWKRDRGRCRVCGASDELHFDHIIPFSRGGTSLSADNIQLLCARHNIAKRDSIQ